MKIKFNMQKLLFFTLGVLFTLFTLQTIKTIQSKQLSTRSEELAKEDRFSKDLVCLGYRKEIESNMAEKDITEGDVKLFNSIEDIFYSPAKNECMYSVRTATFFKDDHKKDHVNYSLYRVRSDEVWSTHDSRGDYHKSRQELEVSE